MFGFQGFLIAFGWLNLPLIFVIVLISVAKILKKPFNFPKAAVMMIVQLIFWAILLPRYYVQFNNYSFLKNLATANVVSIEINSKTWSDVKIIDRLVRQFNQAIWHEDNHDSGGPFVSLSITLRSGEVWRARIGRYYDNNGVLIAFYRSMDDKRSFFYYGNTYIPSLMHILTEMSITLPSGE